MTIESTATQIFESGNGYRARLNKGWMQGYLVTVTPSGQVWSSFGLTPYTPEDCTPVNS